MAFPPEPLALDVLNDNSRSLLSAIKEKLTRLAVKLVSVSLQKLLGIIWAPENTYSPLLALGEVYGVRPKNQHRELVKPMQK